jgi:ubiquinone biosynthesis protein Coq4
MIPETLPFALVLLVAVVLADRQVRRLFKPKPQVEPAELADLKAKLTKVTAAVSRIAAAEGFKLDV